MRYIQLILISMTVFVLGGCVTAPTQGARRYADSCYEQSLEISRFFLLERPEVQRDIRLKKSQRKALAAALNSPRETVPGFIAWRGKCAAMTNEQRLARAAELSAEREAIMPRWLGSQIDGILSLEQRERLEALLLQLKGEAALVTVPGLAEKLRLTAEQRTRIQGIIDGNAKELEPFRRRYGRTMLQFTRSSQTREESRREQDAMFLVITEILKSRDEELLSLLTEGQCTEWAEMLGKPLPIRWPAHAFFYFPFTQQ